MPNGYNVNKQFVVDFEHNNEFTKASIKGVFAENAETAIEVAKLAFAKQDEWTCVAVDRIND
jgi:hypothetical protein